MSGKNVRSFLLAVVLCLSGAQAFGQKGYKWEYGFIAGVSNYLGDIGGREQSGRPFIYDMKLAKTRWNPGVYGRYKFHPNLSTRLSVNYLRIAGDDKLSINPGRKYRNLSFRNDIFDIESTIHWHFYNSDKPMGIYRRTNVYFSSYLFIGIGGFFHNPKTLYQGSWVALQPIKTEAVNYSRFGYCIPFGAGFYVSLTKRRKVHRIGLEFNWRYTNTDYLDDISTVYKSPAELSSQTAVALSNRNPELSKQPEGFAGNYGWQGLDKNGNPVNKAPRGNADNKDSYITLNVSYGVSIKHRRYHRTKGRRIRAVSF